MNKELENLLEDLDSCEEVKTRYGLCYAYSPDVVEELRQAILELKSIKESDSSKSLEIVKKCKDSNFLNTWFPKFVEDLKTVENYILKSQEQEKINDDNLAFENGNFMSGFWYKGKQIIAMPLNEYDRLMKEEEVLDLIKEKEC